MIKISFVAEFNEQGMLIYPGGSVNYRNVIIESDNAVGLWMGGEVLPEGVSLHAVSNPENSPVGAITINKVRFLDLLGDAAVSFKAAIRSTETPAQLAAALEVAQEYLNASSELDLMSTRFEKMLGLLQQAGIINEQDATRISKNQTDEEAAADALAASS